MIKMHHLQLMQYDYQDNLKEVDLDLAGNKAYYVYDANGERVRKIVIQSGKVEQRFYIGDYEYYEKDDIKTETLKIQDDKQVVALVETRVIASLPSQTIIRYQLANHLDNASLELNETGEIISYEEYHPFGTTSYRSGCSEVEVSLKRYKYVFKELDNETGLYYYGMRYYAPWIARFIRVDPLQFEYPHYTPFQYAGNKPISYIDLDGAEEAEPEKQLDLLKQIGKAAWKGAKATNPIFSLGELAVRKFGETETGKNIVNALFSPKEEKRIIQTDIYWGTDKNGKLNPRPILVLNTQETMPNASFTKQEINSIKALYERYQIEQPVKLNPKSKGECIDCMNWSLSQFYDIDRSFFMDPKHPGSSQKEQGLEERVDYTGLQFYKAGFLVNYEEAGGGLTKGKLNFNEVLENMVGNKAGNFFFIISYSRGYHTTAIIMEKTDQNTTFTFLDQNDISTKSTEQLNSYYNDTQNMIYLLKPPKK